MTKELKNTRRKIKEQLTRFATFLKNFSPDKAGELAIRLSRCEDLWDEFDKIQTQLEQIDLNQTVERDSFENSYFETVAFCKELICNHCKIEQDSKPSDPRTNPSPLVVSGSIGVSLPTIELPQYFGSYDQWLTFADTFRTLVDSKPISSIKKLIYLKSCLKGDAAEVLSSLEVSDHNYSIAWQLLTDRFENKKLIINKHVKALFDLPCLHRESVTDLRRFLDDLNKNLRALKSLGQNTEQWDTLLLYLVTSKLDAYSKREWEKSVISNIEPTMKDFYEFLSQRCQLLETLHTKQSMLVDRTGRNSGANLGNFNRNRNHPNVRSFVANREDSENDQQGSLSCYYCKLPHKLYRCKKFLDLTTKARIQEVRKLQICSNCLSRNHSLDKCLSGGCKRCGGNHNSLLHEENHQTSILNQKRSPTDQHMTLTAQSSSYQDQQQVLASSESSFQNASEVLLSTAIAYVLDKDNKAHECRILMDNASQSNFMSSRLCQILGLSKQRVNIPVVGINQLVSNLSHVTNATIKSRFNNYKMTTSFLVIDKISGNLPTARIDITHLNIPKNIFLADSTFNVPGEVDILVGANAFWDMLCVGQIRLAQGQPVLQKTKMGWIISGTLPKLKLKPDISEQTQILCNVSKICLQEQMERFWSLEENCCTNKESIFTHEEQECEDHFRNTTERREDGHFQVRLPFKGKVDEIGETYAIALRRFSLLEKRLSKHEDFKVNYNEFINEYEEMGHMSRVSKEMETRDQINYYLPHHGVYKESSITTKLRVVFDASCKSSTGVSLNDRLKIGPTLQEDLFSILTRFRKHNVVLAADIAKMYRMVYIHPDDRNFQRILWRDDKNQPVQEFCLNTVTYGTASAAYLAVRCLHQVAHDNKLNYPDACEVILRDFYVDDLLTGMNTVEEANKMKQELLSLLEGYGFQLRKWISNKVEVLADLKETKNNVTHLISDPVTKTLGLTWNAKEDELQYSVNISNARQSRITKRTVLSSIAQIYDPLGLISPCIVQAKLIMQRLWQLGITWDETLPADLHSSWKHFYSHIENINSIRIPRHAFCVDPKHIELHCFSDASEKAYGACIYVRTTDHHEQHFSHLLCAKSKVAPLKKVTLPRLELCGCTLLSRLVHKVMCIIGTKINKIFYYTDSTIALAWISTDPGKLKTFVSNRVAEIQRLTDMHNWRHVCGKDNPADMLSRGISSNELRDSSLWWQGPYWLLQHEQLWSVSKVDPLVGELPEIKGVRTFKITLDFNIFERYSLLSRLQRVTAFCLRFKNNALKSKEHRVLGSLTVDELEEALLALLRLAQRQTFSTEYQALKNSKELPSTSRLLPLNPYLDKNKLLRVGGRLSKAEIHYNNKYPIILPNKHKLTKLIVKQEHLKNLHAGPKTLLASLRLKYWPIAGMNEVKNILRECVICIRSKPVTYKYLMSDLPRERINPSRPFNICGVDYAGPYDIKPSKLRGNKILKSYMCIFICFTTKAVHIELAPDLTTDSFLNALKRFIARRGKCSYIYSDNGTNFIGAKTYLTDQTNFLNNLDSKREINEYLSQESIVWRTIPPRSPSHGGLWESAVKCAKNHIRKVIGCTILTYEELYTLMTQVESILNSRPLTPLTQSPDDLNFLTPGHFLIGDSLLSVPQRNLENENPNRLTRYNHLTQMVQHFWRRWTHEYLPSLQQRSKWRKAGDIVPSVGSMVIVMDDNLPPLRWRIGRIEQVFHGSNNQVRVASVKTANGLIKRSITKLCPLFLDNN